MEKNKKTSDYNAKDIYVLEGLEPVRRRPGMYIGSTGPEGLHHLIFEVADNSLDEATMGFATEIEISLLPGNRISVSDNGRGIPVDVHPQTKKSALETVMTYLHAGAKFGGKTYRASGGLHGVGVSVVCALSKWMRAEVSRDGEKYFQEYERGKPITKLTKMGKTDQSGTTIIFEPDPEIFKKIEFSLKKIIDHLRLQAYLIPKLKIRIKDERKTPPFIYTFYFEGGIKSLLRWLCQGEKILQENIFYGKKQVNDIQVEATFCYTEDIESEEMSFANNILTREGGTHLTGFRAALTRTIQNWGRQNKLLTDKDKIEGEDVREGLTAIISVKLPEPEFEGQTKQKLGNPEARSAVETMISDLLPDFLEKNPRDGRMIIEKCLLAARSRQAAKNAKESVLRKGLLEGLALPGKLTDCTSKNPEESELFIVEGESAGGCLAGNTKVALTDGRNLTFKELIREDKKGKKNYCYTIKKDGSIGIGLIKYPRKTRENAKVIKIILDNKEEIICTPDHLFMLKDGKYKKAKDLKSNDSLMPLYRKFSRIKDGFKIDGYEMVYEQKRHKWIYTHFLANKYNLKNKKCKSPKKFCIHHKDFNKLNNNPDNLVQMDKQKHLELHAGIIKETMARPEIQEKIRAVHQSKEYREKVRATMLKPDMRKKLSERAKKQWENEEYKQYMVQKFLEFYQKNPEYRERNNKLLYENQEKYWSDLKNRENWAQKVKEYFKNYPEKKKNLSLKAKEQWENEELLEWRSQKTKEQWTQEFRIKRKKTYNETYKEKALSLMRKIFEKYGEIDKEKYNQERLKLKDKSILRFDTICQRFFANDEEKLEEAVLNYNHKIKKIIPLKKKIDVYDLEVENTHNFALSSGIFIHNSSRQGRDRRTQAILPLRGKILNVERVHLNRVLSSKEVKSLIIALGTAIADDFDINKLRYHKIIIMADADSVTGDMPILLFNKETQEYFLTEVEKFIENCDDTFKYQVLTYNSKTKKREQKEICETIKHPLRTPLFEIKTCCGYSIKVTSCHSIYVFENGKVITKKGSEIKKGDLLIFPKSFPRGDREYLIDLQKTILNSNYENISVKVSKDEVNQIPAMAWCELNSSFWSSFQKERELVGISRKKMGKEIQVYDKVIQQWEQKIDNVMPRFYQFQSYLEKLNIEPSSLKYDVYIPLNEIKKQELPQSAKFYLKNHTHEIRTQFKLDKDLAYLIGWFLGDGCFSPEKKSPNRFTVVLGKEKAENYIKELSRIIKEKFGAKTIIEYKKPNAIQLHFHSFEFRLILTQLGLLGKKAEEKFIPDIFFNVKKEIQEGLLQGLLQSDGFITVWQKKNNIRKAIYGWRLASQKLIEGTLTIFRQWGIFPSYSVFQGKDHLRKDGKIIRSNFKSYDLAISTVDYLLQTKNIWEGHKDAQKLENYFKKVNYKKAVGKNIQPISQDFVGLPVKEVKEIKNPEDKFIYDFSVVGDQNFIAGTGGILCHNTDGNHIRTLLLTLFYRYFKPIIEKGYLYIAQPPLYKIQCGKKVEYAYTDEEKEEVLKKIGNQPVSIQRYKGLGEMNAEELWETTMEPEKRILRQVTIEDAEEADRVFDILMGKEVLPRKQFIQTYAKEVKNLDI